MNNVTRELHERLLLIKGFLDVNAIIKPYQGKNAIQKYYRKSHFAYLSILSTQGFMHMGLSYDGKFKKADLYGQANFVNTYLKNKQTAKVLELGAGNGSNSAYLATLHPTISFTGVDLSKNALRQFRSIKNYQHILGDYHDLSIVDNGRFDLIFAIETICHSTDKKTVLKEAYKKLKKNGVFIIYDGYSEKPRTKLTKEELLGKQLLEKSMAVENFEERNSLKRTIRSSSFTLVREEDLTSVVLPSMKRFEKIALKFVRYPFIARGFMRILPFDMVKNVVAALLLGLYCEKLRITSYYLHILKKS